MYEIKKVNVINLALISGWLSIGFTVVYGMFIWFLTGFIASGSYGSGSSSSYITYIPIVLIFGYIIGFIFGAVIAFLYNLWASWAGGIKLEINQIVETQKSEKPIK